MEAHNKSIKEGEGLCVIVCIVGLCGGVYMVLFEACGKIEMCYSPPQQFYIVLTFAFRLSNASH